MFCQVVIDVYIGFNDRFEHPFRVPPYWFRIQVLKKVGNLGLRLTLNPKPKPLTAEP